MNTVPLRRRAGLSRAVFALVGLCRGSLVLLTPVAAGLGVSSALRAEVIASEPYYVVVTVDEVNIRCGSGSVWYPVATVKAGTVLQVDGAEQGWLRVSYPAGTAAMVRTADAQRDEGAATVRLTSASKLLANNPRGGLSESWRPLLEEALPAGTTLALIEEVRDSAGQVEAFRVAAPETARGFISERSIRPATEAEVAQIRPPADPAPATTEESTAQAPQTTPEQTAQAPTTQDAPAEPQQQPAETIAQTPVEQTPAPAPAETSARRAIGTMEQLNTAFEGLKRVPTEDAEIEPLIAEYQRFIGTLSDSAADSGWKRYAESRIELLRARLELQRQLLALRDAEAFANRGSTDITRSIEQMMANPLYKVVGRLGASTVYNGQNLPLMYRVQSVEGGVGRTLAYVLPAEDVDLAGRVGLIVGVVGDAETDVELSLPIIRPKKIDVLTTGATSASPGTP